MKKLLLIGLLLFYGFPAIYDGDWGLLIILVGCLFLNFYWKRSKEPMTIDQAIKKMKRRGYSDKQIKKKLTREVAGRVLEGLGGSRKAAEDYDPQENSKDPDPTLYEWRLGVCEQNGWDEWIKEYKENDPKYKWDSDEYCPDCHERSKKEPMTRRYWDAAGVPRSGFSICQDGCGCKLVAVEE